MPWIFEILDTNICIDLYLTNTSFGFFSPALEPPRFIKKLDASRVIKEHDSTRYDCRIGGSPEINVVWYKGDTQIHPSDKYSMSFIDNVAVIEMNNLSIEDSGDYTCEAQNSAGSANSSTSLKVKGQNPFFIFNKSPP